MGVAGGLDFCVWGSKGPEVLGLEEAGTGIPGAGQSRSSEGRELAFCFADSWERKGLGLNTPRSHVSPGPRLQEVRGLGAQTPGSGVEPWKGQGPACLCPQLGRGDCPPESLGDSGGKEGQFWLLLGNCGTLNRAMKRDSPVPCPRA